jgi:hypothetical protein
MRENSVRLIAVANWTNQAMSEMGLIQQRLPLFIIDSTKHKISTERTCRSGRKKAIKLEC